jgi:hypothetical protein
MKVPNVALAFFSLLAVVSAANARVSLGTMEGFVVDARGNAVPGATVTIQTTDGRHPHATHTDTKGHFQFARFETGQYDLRAYFNASYSVWYKGVVLRSSKATVITLHIAPGIPTKGVR